MDVRREYLSAVDVSDATYQDNNLANKRVRSMYGTARQGQLKKSVAEAVWKEFFLDLAGELSNLPNSLEGFDALAIERIRELATILRSYGKGNFGLAQKMFNLFMKDAWALGQVPDDREAFLHVPVDRNILAKLTQVPHGWSAWTKVSSEDGEALVLHGYMRIQESYRRYWKETGAKFSSPIEFDQILWHRIRLVESD